MLTDKMKEQHTTMPSDEPESW